MTHFVLLKKVKALNLTMKHTLTLLTALLLAPLVAPMIFQPSENRSGMTSSVWN